MSILEIPLRTDTGYFELSIEIEGSIYFFDFKYNARLKQWIMNIKDVDKVPIILGLPLLTEVDIKSQYVFENLFKNTIFMYDKLGLQRNANRDNLGKDIIFLYSEDV